MWVGLGWVTPVQKIMGWVGFGPFAVGLGWVNKYGPMSISGLMGLGFGIYMYDVVVKRSRSLSHLLISSCRS